MMEPGWYYAQGDPQGTVRFWDGELWQGEFRYESGAAPGAPQPVAGGYQPMAGGYQQPMAGGYQTYPESSQATMALVLGILGLVICGLLGPFAWHIGSQEIAGIDAGRRDPSNRGTAQAGRILGMIVSALLILGVALIVILLIAGAASA